MMPIDCHLMDEYWKQVQIRWKAPGPAPEQYYEAFRFGNTPEAADELAQLVLAGTKTATSALRWEFEQSDSGRPPQPGDFSIVLDSSGEPVCIIETVEIRNVPFSSAGTERFTYEYGEGDRTPDWWRREMWAYYTRLCREHGWIPSEDMPLVCEHFRVVYP